MSPNQVAKRAACSLLLAVLLLLSAAGAASAITLVGTYGRDQVSVRVDRQSTLVITPAYVYAPPASKADDASCRTTVDVVRLRPTDVRCQITGPYVLSVDLKGGDDQLLLAPLSGGTFSAPAPTSITVDGGAGADTIAVDATRPAPVVRGGDGDDVLSARGRAAATRSSAP
jgi:hypothetical protein